MAGAPFTAAAALPLSGRYAPMAGQAAHGLRAWARSCGAELEIEDSGDDPRDAARAATRLAGEVDIFFGPYGSGAMRAVAEALAGSPAVVWNHGGAAAPRAGGRTVDVLGPAESYWSGLAEVLRGDGVPLDRVVVLRADTGFGHAVAAGAVASLRAAGSEPHHQSVFDERSARATARRALATRATAIVGCGRLEDDLALGRALAEADVAVGLVACGVHAAAEALGASVVGWLGPCQWLAGDSAPPVPLAPDADYPAAQALAAGLLAEQALAAAGSPDPDAVWDAVRSLRTGTFLGPFAVDDEGRQLAHRPLLVRWVPGPGGPTRRVVWRPGS